MTRKHSSILILLLGLFVAALITPGRAGAIEVKKDLYSGGGGGGGGGGGPQPKNPLTPALQQKLVDTVSDESYKYVGEQSELKASGKLYTDLEAAKMKYMPAMKDGKMTVTCRLEAAEYKPKKDSEGKGTATGKRKVLVFTYLLDNNAWKEQGDPKWEDVEATGTATAKQK